MARAIHFLAWPGLVAVALAAALTAVVRAQEPEPVPISSQAKRLNELLKDRALNSDELIARSRLLSDPIDQVAWLVDRAQTLEASNKDAAIELVSATRLHIDGISKLPNSPPRDQFSELSKRLDQLGKGKPVVVDPDPDPVGTGGKPLTFDERKKRLMDATTPEALLAELKDWNPNPDVLKTIGPENKALLWARGVTLSKFGAEHARPIDGKGFDRPRTMLFDLIESTITKEGPLPLFEVLNLQKVVGDLRKNAAASLPYYQQSVDILDGLLVLALRGPVDSASKWEQSARSLEAANVWAWAALARILQAGPNRDAEAMRALDTHIAGLGVVAQAAASDPKHVSISLGRWRDRLREKGAIFESLADHMTDLRSARDTLAQQFRAQAQSGNANGAFELMQKAKAAEVGGASTIRTLSIDNVKAALSGDNRPRVHLFVEMLSVSDGGSTGYWGLAVYSENGQNNLEDKFGHKLIGPERSATDLVTAATKLVGTGTLISDAKLIIAPDGEARTGAWSGYATLQQRLSNIGARVLFVPSAPAMVKGGGWTAEKAVQYWYFAPGGGAVNALVESPTKARTFNSVIEQLGSQSSCTVIGLGVPLEGFTSGVKATELAKKLSDDKKPNVIAIGFSQ